MKRCVALAVLAVLAALWPASLLSATAETGSSSEWSSAASTASVVAAAAAASAENTMVDEIVAAANGERAGRGVAPLEVDPAMSESARAWAREMARSGFRHDVPLRVPGYRTAGENIARGRVGCPPTAVGCDDPSLHLSSGAALVTWMRSDSHRRVLLAARYDRTGVGVFCDAQHNVWIVQRFGRTTTAEGRAASLTSAAPAPIMRLAKGGNSGMTCVGRRD